MTTQEALNRIEALSESIVGMSVGNMRSLASIRSAMSSMSAASFGTSRAGISPIEAVSPPCASGPSRSFDGPISHGLGSLLLGSETFSGGLIDAIPTAEDVSKDKAKRYRPAIISATNFC